MAPTDSANRRVLIPLLDGVDPELTTTLATMFVTDRTEKVFIYRPVVVPRQTPLDQIDIELKPDYQAVEEAVSQFSSDRSVDGMVLVGRDTKQLLTQAVDEHDINLVVAATASKQSKASSVGELVCSLGLDTVVAYGFPWSQPPATILVPVAGGPNSGLAVDTARAFQRRYGSWIEFLHVVETDATRSKRNRGREFLVSALDRIGGYDRANTWLLEADDIAKAIIKQTTYYDATIIGSSRKGWMKRSLFGSTAVDIRSASVTSVLEVQIDETTRKKFVKQRE